jgi:hypothetical protein
MRSAAIIASLVLGLAGTATAQPGLTPAASPALPPPPAMPPQGDALNENTALALSLGGTMASWSLILAASELSAQSRVAENLGWIGAAGVLLGPSFGHWYARSFVTRGLGLRIAGVVTTTVAFGYLAGCEDGCNHSGVLAGALLTGVGLMFAGTLDDIITAPGAARRYNERSGSFAVVPMVRRDASGVMLTGRF